MKTLFASLATLALALTINAGNAKADTTQTNADGSKTVIKTDGTVVNQNADGSVKTDAQLKTEGSARAAAAEKTGKVDEQQARQDRAPRPLY